jgi:agmatine deiminase
MAWPVRRELWRDRLDEAKAEYAAVARAIAAFEPVLMVANPGDGHEVRDRCGAGIDVLELPIDDSWMRDSGPVFVRDGAGRLAVVAFGFNAWGERWHPYADDALVPERIAAHLGLPLFRAPFVLEGGSFLVDGEGTLVTTEQCLLNPNRNPGLGREAIEQGLRDYLGIRTVVWLPFGHSLDVGPQGTDGHVDGIATYLAPGHVLLEVPADPAASEHDTGRANEAVLRAAHDAAGRPFTVSRLDPGPDAQLAYANLYLANQAVIVPIAGTRVDEPVLASLAAAFPTARSSACQAGGQLRRQWAALHHPADPATGSPPRWHRRRCRPRPLPEPPPPRPPSSCRCARSRAPSHGWEPCWTPESAATS